MGQSRVAVVRALPGLGDMLCIVPTLRALRTARPHAHVSVVGLPSAAPVLERFPRYVDDLLHFPGYPGIPEEPLDPPALVDFLARIHRSPFDLVLQLHGSGLHSNGFAALLAGGVTAGFFRPGQWCPDDRHFLAIDDAEPEARRGLRLLARLGIPDQGDRLEFPVTAADRAGRDALIRHSGLTPGGYACLHPGAARPGRRWPAERFIAAGTALSHRGLRIAVTGVRRESELTAAVASGIGEAAVDLGGRSSLGVMAALLSTSRLLVTNDTGVSHLASALDVPSVIIVSWSDSRRWAPLDGGRHRLLETFGVLGNPWADIDHRCLGDACRRLAPPPDGAEPARVPVQSVVETALELLEGPGPEVRAMRSPSRGS